MAFSLFGPFLGSLLCFCICFVYPASLSFQLLLNEKASPSGALKNDHLQHVMFWILCSWICCIESFPPLALLFQYLPFYYEIKCVLFYWLASPQFKGAGWLWLNVINPAYERAAPMCVQMYNERCPPQVKAAIEKAAAAISGTRTRQSDDFNKSRQPSRTADVAPKSD